MGTDSHWFIRARLKTRQLLLLVALADEGNIHRAAQQLSMTQPAASRLLKDLEDMLELPLFERLPRGMRPTWYGETMIRHARMALDSLKQAHEELGALRTGHFGQVGVGAVASQGLRLLPPAVVQVKQEHPSLRVSIEIDSSPVLLARLEQGRLDILVCRLFAEHDKTHLRYESLTEESICAVTRPGHPLLATQALTLRELLSAGLSAGWIVPPAGSVLRHRFDLLFQQEGLAQPINTVEASALLFITRMLQQSDMIAVVGADVGHYYAAYGIVTVLPLALPCHMDAFGIITRTDRLLSPAAQVMMAALKQTCLSQYGRPLDADG
ncbi:LysR family transcriptional regulator [Verminephrobacter aporrectodeae subsp. tuberculatae]|uniref:LysR family transcriptional regulator n=1 Tax=Verminephrobacter aporrectodeae subsp. tuberculatae TaxID=1110392 RepID=A0ABT3KSV5_9BURK|nr:LysR family transcriptional regulator [Verminephrobacter aporrectodeae]MCW5321411.1 LysR family transcriptional regulator [Verminephrobacter aporrectodeae subsp. tuberculatae]